ncbi:MAG: GAF domain-containing protein [Chloroflexota bacterium]
MRTRFRQLLQPPVFEDLRLTTAAQYTNAVLLILFVFSLAFFAYPAASQEGAGLAVTSILIVVEILLLILLRMKYVQLTGALTTTLVWLGLSGVMLLSGGIQNPGISSLALVIIIGYLSLGSRGGLFFTGLTLVTIFAFSFLGTPGDMPAYLAGAGFSSAGIYSLVFIVISLLLSLVIRNVNRSTERAIINLEALTNSISLVEENKKAISTQLRMLDDRNLQLQLLSTIVTMLPQQDNIVDITQQTVDFIAKGLQIDHANIFLVDSMEEFVILHASNSPPGKSLIDASYRLPISTSDLGFTTSEGTVSFRTDNKHYLVPAPRVFSDVRTQLTFPLIASDKFLGLLNIQSTSESLDPEVSGVLRIIAAQIGLRMKNRSLENLMTSQQSELGHLVTQTVQSAWSRVAEGQSLGYQYDRLQVLPSSEQLPTKVLSVLEEGKAVNYVTKDKPAKAKLIAPIILRGAVIGVIGYDSEDPKYAWQPEEQALLETITSRVSLALENARLLAESQQRAERERLVADITSAVSVNTNIEAILISTITEIKRLVGDSEIIVQLGSDNVN